MSPFRFPTGGGFQTTRMAVEDSAKALTKSGAAPGSLIKGAIFLRGYSVDMCEKL